MWLILVFLSQTMQTSLKGLTLISTPHHTWHWASWMNLIVFSFFKINLFIYFIFGCVGSSLLRAGFLWLRRAGTILCYGVRVSHCSGFSCCGARALGSRASVVAVPMSHNYRAHVPQLLKPKRLEPVLCDKRSHRNEKPVHRTKE